MSQRGYLLAPRLLGLQLVSVLSSNGPVLEQTSGISVSVLHDALGIGESLLQARSQHMPVARRQFPPQSARDILPESLVTLGLEVFGGEEELNKIVNESTEINTTYGHVSVVLRIRANDDAEYRLGGNAENGTDYGFDTIQDVLPVSYGTDYGFDTIQDVFPVSQANLIDVNGSGLTDYRSDKSWLESLQIVNGSMLNMIDIGANYGIVAMAVFNKFPGHVRAVVVEPVAATYFFLRWNLWLNSIPHLFHEDWLAKSTQAGVVALNAAVTAVTGDIVHMCSNPSGSMNSRASDPTLCNCSYETCANVSGVNILGVMDDYFAGQDINLMKMDCEGCEFHSLPALATLEQPLRINRLVGELHVPTEELIDVACMYEDGRYMTKVCRVGEHEWSCCLPLECNPGRQVCMW
jgi:FkbM family methyltransferase